MVVLNGEPRKYIWNEKRVAARQATTSSDLSYSQGVAKVTDISVMYDCTIRGLTGRTGLSFRFLDDGL
jgi:hypothetical protein